MADFDDPSAPAARFGLDNDYEGGEFGDDGEYYALGQKKGKVQSKTKALYGVFDDSSDEEGGRPGFGGGGKGKRQAAVNYSAPVGFVSGGLKGEEKKDSDDSDKSGSDMEEDENEDEGARPHFGLGGGRRGKNGARRRGRYSDPEDSDESGGKGEKKGGRDADAELPQAFGAKERPKKAGSWGAEREQIKPTVDTSNLSRLKAIDGAGGVALRMLQKMGYKGGGLGATGQGITTAIEAHKRGEKEGIGVRTEKKQVMESNEKEADAKKKEKEKKLKKAKKESNWKIDLQEEKGPKKKKLVYKTAEELRAEAAEAGGLKMGEAIQASTHVAIVDMRGKEAKLVSGADINQVIPPKVPKP